jgi:DNA-binding HxlR family transcriptional regulator
LKACPSRKRMLILQKHWKHDVMLEAFGFTPKEFEKLKNKSIVVQEAFEKGKKILVRKNKAFRAA